MRRRTLIGALVLLAGAAFFALPASCQAQVVYKAASTLVNPPQNSTYHLNGNPTVAIPFSSTDQYVQISGAANGQTFNVQWSMDLEYHDNVLPGGDYGTNQIITCDATGFWQHKANGSGALSGTYNASTSSVADAYTDFLDNVTSKGDSNENKHLVNVVQ